MTIETITTKAFLFDMDGTLIGEPRSQGMAAELTRQTRLRRCWRHGRSSRRSMTST